MSIASFRDLEVWKAAVDLAAAVYRASSEFPPEERFGLIAQLRRSATSVASNIAEGHARNSTREFVQFVAIALGSLAEVETQLEIAYRVIPEVAQPPRLRDQISHLRARLLNLRAALLRRIEGVAQGSPAYDAVPEVGFDQLEAPAVPVPRAPCPVPTSP